MNGERRWLSCSAGAFAVLLAACAGALRVGGPVRPPVAGGKGGAPVSGARTGRDAALSAEGETLGGAVDPADAGHDEAPAGVRLAFAGDGTIGAWLVAGPFDGGRLPDESRLSPRLGEPAGDANAPRWRLASSADGAIDLAAALDTGGRASLAYAGGKVHVERAGRHVLLIGVDDAITVFVDGRPVFKDERTRPRRDDEDLASVDLTPGDHTIALALRRRGQAWRLHARWLDPDFAVSPGAYWLLPGGSDSDARALCASLSSVVFDRRMEASEYDPTLTVRFRAGAPLGVAFPVRARLTQADASSSADAIADSETSAAPFEQSGNRERTAALGVLPPAAVEDDDLVLHVNVAGRPLDLPFHPRRAVREATAHAARTLEAARSAAAVASKESLETIEYLRQRLTGFVARGDPDTDAALADARELDNLAAALDQGRDPYDPRAVPPRTGAMRRAYISPVDGHFSEFAVYVPPRFNAAKAYPLIVALHGMNGHPMEMLMWLFGHDDPARDATWEDRHPRRDLEPLEAFVVAPGGHFNTMYRDMGEDDVMRVVDWAMATYPIDPARVTITGPSMGGIGAAACALHRPDRFAAAEPLCGYHSYFVRGDIGGRTLRPWERFLAEQRSNVFWAENGLHIPLYVVHGTKDLPVENSGVLIDRYEELHYDVEHEHPDLGHNVWQTTYEDLKGARWLLPHRRPLHPREVRFKTPRTRWADDAWLHVRELSSSDAWGEVIARIDGRDAFYVATHGVAALSLDRDTERMDDAAPVSVSIDGVKLVFQAGEPIEMHAATQGGRGERARWMAGRALHHGLFKHGAVTGPLRDALHEPLLFVWGASDPAQARANEEVARDWARVRPGVRVDYPIMSDLDFAAAGEPIDNERALFLVGNAKSNALVRELEPDFPIRVDGDGVLVGTTRVACKDASSDPCPLGAAFIRPNPRRPDRYVVVVEGTGPLGTWRSESLPDLLPDYVVYDEGVASARGQLLLGGATVRAAGFFGEDWSLTAPVAVP